MGTKEIKMKAKKKSKTELAEPYPSEECMTEQEARDAASLNLLNAVAKDVIGMKEKLDSEPIRLGDRVRINLPGTPIMSVLKYVDGNPKVFQCAWWANDDFYYIYASPEALVKV